MGKAFANTGVTVIDSASDLPSPASEGLMVFQKDSNELKIYNGISWVSVVDTDNVPAMQLCSPSSVANGSNDNGKISFSGVTSVSINNIFSSLFDNYKMIVNITGVSVSQAIYMRMRSSGLDNANSNYTWAGLNSYSGGSAITSHVGSGGTQTFFFVGGAHTSIYENMPFTFDILQPYLTYRTSIYGFHPNPVTPQSYFNYLGGAMSVTNSYDGFTLYGSSGGTISGFLRVYGYRNSI